MNLSTRDAKVIWHPYTQHQMSSYPIPIVRGEGAYLFDEKNNAYLDMFSSWYVNLHGHAHPDIVKAIAKQAATLEHVAFAGFTHEPAVKLAENMLALLPEPFSKVFYSDNGSTAVEVALKMAYQYWRNVGKHQRKRFIAFKNAYHGDTFGAMSLGKTCGFFTHFDDLFFPVDMFSYPDTWFNDDTVIQKEQNILLEIKQHLEQYADETAALIIEPLVQGSSGMRMCTMRFLHALEALVRSYGVLIIYDEVLTGMGRTGELFACLKAETTPDIICLAKGLTGGFLPLAMTLCQEHIYQAFLGDSFTPALAHGHSFTANPLGCAAALASLHLLQTTETGQQITMIERVNHEMVENLTQVSCVDKPRYCGTIIAFNLKTESGYGSAFSIHLRKQFLEHGLLVRPLGDVIYFLPPYCIKESELKRASEIIIKELQGVFA